MGKYLVTKELKTPLWLKFLRFLKIKRKRKEFFLIIGYKDFKDGEILCNGFTFGMKIIKKIQ
jgi:hypothetical protein